MSTIPEQLSSVGNDFQVIIYQPRSLVIGISDLPLVMANLGLGSDGEEQTRILQLAEGQEITLPVSVPGLLGK